MLTSSAAQLRSCPTVRASTCVAAARTKGTASLQNQPTILTSSHNHISFPDDSASARIMSSATAIIAGGVLVTRVGRRPWGAREVGTPGVSPLSTPRGIWRRGIWRTRLQPEMELAHEPQHKRPRRHGGRNAGCCASSTGPYRPCCNLTDSNMAERQQQPRFHSRALGARLCDATDA